MASVERAGAEGERQPGKRAVAVELRHIERAVVEQVEVGGAVGRVVGAGGDELVDVIEALVVAEVEHHPAVGGEHVVGGLVLEAAEGGALLRGRGRVGGIDLDDPAEAVGLVRLLGEVEALVEGAPAVGALGQAEAFIVGGLRVAFGQFADEVAVEILLGHHPGAPGGDAAGAVVDGAEDRGAGRVGGGLQPRVAGGGAGQRHRGGGGDAAVLRAVADHLPAPFTLRISTMLPPWAAISMSTRAWSGSETLAFAACRRC